MEWIGANWFWIAILGLFLWMLTKKRGGHAGHGGDGGHSTHGGGGGGCCGGGAPDDTESEEASHVER
jgi:uncharacterized membrane protein YgcG